MKIKCLEITQPIGTFYIAVVNAYDLCEISYSDIRDIAYKEGELDKYMGIQRKTVPSRIKEIKEYIKTTDACFPTSVLIHVEPECVVYDQNTNEMTLSETGEITTSEIAKVLDGQHRLEGFKKIFDDVTERDSLRDFEINVSIFVGMDLAQQAIIFSTVNLAQTKVHKSLVYDLNEYSKVNTYEKICHNIVVALDEHPNSPFYKKIKRLGSATPDRKNETLTQSTIVTELLNYMASSKVDRINDRDVLMRGKKPKYANAQEARKLIFKNMAIDDQEKEIADIVYFYFSAARDRWPKAWESRETGQMLSRTNGFRGLMKFLRDLYLDILDNKLEPTKEVFIEYFSRTQLVDEDFNIDRYVPGSSGAANLYKDLKEQILGIRQ